MMWTRVLEKVLEVNCSLHNNPPKARFSVFAFTPDCILVSTWKTSIRAKENRVSWRGLSSVGYSL